MLSFIFEPVPWIVIFFVLVVYHYFWDVMLQGQTYFAGRAAIRTREKELYRGGLV